MFSSKPVLAIDIDGVLILADYAWRRHYSRLQCGRQHPSYTTSKDWDRWKHLCSKCWDYVLHQPDVIYAHKLRDHALESLANLSRVANLFVVTTRPSDTFEYTKNWLFWSGVSQFTVDLRYSDDKLATCKELGACALIDDAPHNIEPLFGSSVTPVIYDADYNQGLPGRRVRNWLEGHDALREIALNSSTRA